MQKNSSNNNIEPKIEVRTNHPFNLIKLKFKSETNNQIALKINNRK